MTALVLAAGLVGGYFADFSARDDECYTNCIPNAEAVAFLEPRIPRFECPDKTVERAYYFRWWTFRKHIRKSKSGHYILSEFLPDVPWAGPENTIACPLGHHIREGRWLGRGEIARSHLEFMLSEGWVTGPNTYANWPAVSALDLERVTGERDGSDSLLGRLVEHHQAWEKGWVSEDQRVGLDGDGLFRISNGREGMEISPSPYGARPILNSAMAANAKAVALLAARAGKAQIAADFKAKGEALSEAVRTKLWNLSLGFFTCRFPDGRLSGVCELNGYAPWYFGLVSQSFDVAWRSVTDASRFDAPWGLTSIDQSSGDFRIDYEGHECKWNGPVWPYATSMVLAAMADYIRGGGKAVTASDYASAVRKYAASHVIVAADGSRRDWIDEVQNPFTGEWISRTILMRKGALPRERGKDYNHSTFCDLVITGICGLVPRLDGKVEIRPLAPSDWDWWRLENVSYHGRSLTIFFDRTGEKYGKCRGLSVLDGEGRAVHWLGPR